MNLKTFSQNKLGFTLIELLIVIALLGALAVGMLAAIDPLEQFKKGNDTSTRNTVEEIYNSMIRYYAIKTKFPWTVADESVTTFGPEAANSSDAEIFITSVINAGELKSDFVALAGVTRLGNIIMYSPDPDHLSVCYKPVSKSFQADNNTKYTSDGLDLSASTDCKSLGGTSDCYWCVK